MFTLTFDHLVYSIRPCFQPTILKRGWSYYNQDSVRDYEVDEEGIVRATVYGSKPYQVRLNLKMFMDSECDCPYGHNCKHMAAVVFETCSRTNLQPVYFLDPNRAGSAPVQEEIDLGLEESAATAAASSSSAPLPKPPQRKAAKPKIPAPRELGSASEWHQYIEKQLDKLPRHRILDSLYLNMTRELLPLADDWKPELRLLYRLQVILHAMNRVEQLTIEIKGYYYGNELSFYLGRFSNQCLEDIREIVQQLDIPHARALYSHLLQETAAYLADNAFPEHPSYMNWQAVYSLLWSSLLNEQQWMLEERKRLEAAAASAPSPKKKALLILALIHFLIEERQDEEASRLIATELSDGKWGDFHGLFEMLRTGKEWTRLVFWLQQMLPMVKYQDISLYFQYWKEAMKQVSVESDWREAALHLMPMSYYHYSEVLMEQQCYPEWIDLNIAAGRTPLELSSSDLKKIESADIRLLLPLYHLSIEKCILEKNRNSYKLAVRLLKKLRQLYRRLKRQERFEQYIRALSAQYSRYRALIEELQRGKLME